MTVSYATDGLHLARSHLQCDVLDSWSDPRLLIDGQLFSEGIQSVEYYPLKQLGCVTMRLVSSSLVMCSPFQVS